MCIHTHTHTYIYYFCKKYCKLIITQYHKVDCVSGVPKLSFWPYEKVWLTNTLLCVGDLLYICFWLLRPNGAWYIMSSQKRDLLNWSRFSVPFRVISFRSFSINSGQKAKTFLTAESTAFHVFVCISFLPCRLLSFRARTAFYSFLVVAVFVLGVFFGGGELGSCDMRDLTSLARDWTYDPCKPLDHLGSPSF